MYELAIGFDKEVLFEEFATQYIIEYGKKKFEDVVQIVNSSIEIKFFIQDVLIRNMDLLTFDNIQSVLNSKKFFLFSKEETICLAGLSIIMKIENLDRPPNKNHEQEIVKIMAELIDKCSRLKYNRFNNFFQKFERRLTLINNL